MRARFMWISLCASVALLGCSDEDGSQNNDPPETLSVDGKGDLSNGIENRGELAFGSAVEGVFSADFEMFAYTIRARSGADFTATVAQRGSEDSLDTRLFIYAPTDDRGFVRIGQDDDGGFSKLSKLQIEVRKDADFLLVIGTEDGDGRGEYKIELTCNNADCGLAPPDIDASCPDAIDALIEECVNEHADTDIDLNGSVKLPVEQFVTDCTAAEQAVDYHESECQLGDDEWCFEDFDTFFMDRMMADCEANARDFYIVDDSVGYEVRTNAALTEIFADASFECDGFCAIDVTNLSYQGTHDLQALTESARPYTRRPWELLSDGATSSADAEEAMDFALDDVGIETTGLFNAVLSEMGSNVEVAEISGLYSGGFVEGRIFVLHFADVNEVVLVEFTIFEF